MSPDAEAGPDSIAIRRLPRTEAFDLTVLASPQLVVTPANGNLPLDERLQAITIVVVKGSELERLSVPGDRSEHLRLAHDASLAAEEHQLSYSSWLYWTLKA